VQTAPVFIGAKTRSVCQSERKGVDRMKRMKWITAVLLILVMMVFGGCSDRGELNDGTLNNGNGTTNSGTDDSMGDGTMNNGKRSNDYDSNFNDGGFIDDMADDVEDGMDNVRDKMNTVENDTKTQLGRMAEEPQLNR